MYVRQICFSRKSWKTHSFQSLFSNELLWYPDFNVKHKSLYIGAVEIATQKIHICKLLNGLNDGNTVNQLQCQVIKDPEKKLRIQLGFEPRTFWLLVRHSYHWATGSLVAEECSIDVNILRIEFKPRKWLGYTGKWFTTCKARHTNSALISLPGQLSHQTRNWKREYVYM